MRRRISRISTICVKKALDEGREQQRCTELWGWNELENSWDSAEGKVRDEHKFLKFFFFLC